MAQGSTAKDWKLYVPASADFKTCLVEADCADLLTAPENFQAPTKNYCGVGAGRRLLSVSENNPTDNTLTLQTTSEFDHLVLRELAIGECPFIIQRRHCKGGVETYRYVQFTTRTPQGRLTGHGPNATDDPQITNYDGSFFNMVWVGPPDESVPSLFINNQGRNEGAPTGVIDGVNTIFILNPAPAEGYPVIVTLNAVVQTEGVDYTLTGNTIVFTVAPACDDVLSVLWYDDRYATFGKAPIACWYCDSPNCISGICGGRRSTGCETIHAIYVSDEEPAADNCGVIGDNFTLFATYKVTPSGEFSLIDAEVLSISGAVDALCTINNEIYIATETQVYQGCGTGFISTSVVLPSGTTIRKLAYSKETGDIYALFGNSGVLKQAGDRWDTVLADNQFAVGQQNAIAAAGNVVVTGGDNGTLQASETSGRTWVDFLCPSSVHTVIDVAVGMRDDLSLVDGTIYILATDATKTDLYCTSDLGFTCMARNSWSTIPVCSWKVAAASDDWLIYVQLDNKTYRNANFGCNKCNEWHDVSNSEAPCCSCLSICHHNPTKTAIIGIGDTLTAGDDFYTILDTPSLETVLNVIANDYGNPCDGCDLDLATLAIGTPPADGAAVANGDGTITYTSSVAPPDSVTFTYTIDDECAENQVEATVTITFVAA